MFLILFSCLFYSCISIKDYYGFVNNIQKYEMQSVIISVHKGKLEQQLVTVYNRYMNDNKVTIQSTIDQFLSRYNYIQDKIERTILKIEKQTFFVLKKMGNKLSISPEDGVSKRMRINDNNFKVNQEDPEEFKSDYNSNPKNVNNLKEILEPIVINDDFIIGNRKTTKNSNGNSKSKNKEKLNNEKTNGQKIFEENEKKKTR